MKYAYIIAAVIAAGALLTWFYFDQQVETGQRTISMGYMDLPVSVIPLYVAQEQEYFENEGLDVELTSFQNSNLLNEALINNEVDVAIGPATVPLYTLETKSPNKFKIFMTHGADSSDPFTNFLVTSDSGISSVEELDGKSMLTFPGSNSDILAKTALQNMGYGDLDIKMVSLPQIGRAHV